LAEACTDSNQFDASKFWTLKKCSQQGSGWIRASLQQQGAGWPKGAVRIARKALIFAILAVMFGFIGLLLHWSETSVDRS
jgi:hypothetical protein